MPTTPGITLTATLTDDSGNGIPGKIVCTLNNFGWVPPRIAGSNIIANQVVTGQADANGNISISLYGNYQIAVYGSYYQISVYGTDGSGNLSNAANSSGNYQFLTAGAFDLSTLVPLNNPVGPPVPPIPPGDDMQLTIVLESGNFSATGLSSLYLVTTGGSVITGTLRTAVGVAGQLMVIKKVDAGAGSVTIVTTAGQTIDGLSSYQLTNQNQYVEVVSDGANWQIIDAN